MEDKLYLAALAACESIEPRNLRKIIDLFDLAKEVWEATEGNFLNKGIEKGLIEKIIEWRKYYSVFDLAERIAKTKINLIDYREDGYPELLGEVEDLPLVLYVKGEIGSDWVNFGVVGSRKASSYGIRVTQRITEELVKANVCIVSGLAYGIDGVAQKTVIEGSGKTIGVLASGLDKIYPADHRVLADKIILGGGAIVSEYPPGAPPLKHHFLRRNRIIAGLSVGTLVVEAAKHSGALVTAKYALEYGRGVFAIPGDIDREQAAGTNNLIKNGAVPVFSGKDILEELNLIEIDRQIESKEVILDKTEDMVWQFLNKQPKYLDELVGLTGMTAGNLSSVLIGMEMKGLVRECGGLSYIRNC